MHHFHPSHDFLISMKRVRLCHRVSSLAIRPDACDASQSRPTEVLPPHPVPRGYVHRFAGYGRSRWEIRPCRCISSQVDVVSVFQTYVKPLIKVNSCLIVPPCFLAVSLALEYVQLWDQE